MAPNLDSAEPVQTMSSPTIHKPYERPVNRSAPISEQRYRYRIVWKNVMLFFLIHTMGFYGIWLIFTRASWMTTVYMYLYVWFSLMGITAGAHRLWTHRTYEAKLPLRILLMIMQSTALQNHIYEWSRDHRVHHKFTDTDADPHNAERGFFFSHVGWLLVRKHKDVLNKGKTLDLTDLEADPVVMFQKKYYPIIGPIFCYLIPPFFPWYFWGETLWNSIFVAGFCRYIISLNVTWLVNSAAHVFGNRRISPEQKLKCHFRSMKATENSFVAWAAFGEGWHNYHHVFPWDYKAAELGNYRLNVTTAFLDFMSKIGWAYNFKTVSPEMVQKRAERTGDGSWKKDPSRKVTGDGDDPSHDYGDILWGWGDKDMKPKEVDHIKIYNKLKEI